MKLDRFDITILNTLHHDGRVSWAQLSEKINLSSSATQRRVQALQEAGIIQNFSVELNYPALGYNVQVFVQVKINRHDSEAAQQFREAVLKYPEVKACHKISGNTDFILHVMEKDLTSFSLFLENKILYLPSVKDATSSIVLEAIKETSSPLMEFKSELA